MSFRLQLQQEALDDMREAYFWYEAQKEGLGNAFLDDANTCFQKLARHPQHYQRVHLHFRRVRLDRFPYKVFYEISGDAVIVSRVRHEGQRPLA